MSFSGTSRRGTPRPNPPAENTRPPRYRLLAAAAVLARSHAAPPSESFERECPACGRLVLFTQVQTRTGAEYVIEDHDC